MEQTTQETTMDRAIELLKKTRDENRKQICAMVLRKEFDAAYELAMENKNLHAVLLRLMRENLVVGLEALVSDIKNNVNISKGKETKPSVEEKEDTSALSDYKDGKPGES